MRCSASLGKISCFWTNRYGWVIWPYLWLNEETSSVLNHCNAFSFHRRYSTFSGKKCVSWLPLTWRTTPNFFVFNWWLICLAVIQILDKIYVELFVVSTSFKMYIIYTWWYLSTSSSHTYDKEILLVHSSVYHEFKWSSYTSLLLSLAYFEME